MINTMLTYFKNLGYQKIILWCYLIWYLIIIVIYFEPSIKLWASSIGISCIIGLALLLSTSHKGVKQDIWIKIRLFLFPFCVSSYSATIKDYDFILLFPSNAFHLMIGLVLCLAFLVFIGVVKKVYKSNSDIYSKTKSSYNPV